MWGGYNNVQVRVDGIAQTGTGYSTTYLGNRGRPVHHQRAVGHQAVPAVRDPAGTALGRHHQPNGTTSKLAVPDTQYASANVGTCSGVPEADRSTSRRTCAP